MKKQNYIEIHSGRDGTDNNIYVTALENTAAAAVCILQCVEGNQKTTENTSLSTTIRRPHPRSIRIKTFQHKHFCHRTTLLRFLNHDISISCVPTRYRNIVSIPNIQVKNTTRPMMITEKTSQENLNSIGLEIFMQ